MSLRVRTPRLADGTQIRRRRLPQICSYTSAAGSYQPPLVLPSVAPAHLVRSVIRLLEEDVCQNASTIVVVRRQHWLYTADTSVRYWLQDWINGRCPADSRVPLCSV